MTKSGGTIPPLHILGDLSPRPPRDLRPWGGGGTVSPLAFSAIWSFPFSITPHKRAASPVKEADSQIIMCDFLTCRFNPTLIVGVL